MHMGLTAFLHQHLPRVWLQRGPVALALWPVSALYGALVVLRRMAYTYGIFKTRRVPALVIVVGHVVAGGAGKTPTVIALAQHLRDESTYMKDFLAKVKIDFST